MCMEGESGFILQSAIQVFEPQPDVLYNLDMTARLLRMPRRSILAYCRWGVVHPEVDPDFGGLYFSANAMRTLRQVEYLRAVHGLNQAGIRMTMHLLNEVEQLRQELRMARGF